MFDPLFCDALLLRRLARYKSPMFERFLSMVQVATEFGCIVSNIDQNVRPSMAHVGFITALSAVS